MFKTIVAFSDLCRSSTVRPESWRRRHERVTRIYHGLSRFLKSWTIGTKDRDSVTDALVTWVQGRRQVENSGVDRGASRTHGERGTRAYNGSLGVQPPAGSRGRALGQGITPEAESILPLDTNERQNLPL